MKHYWMTTLFLGTWIAATVPPGLGNEMVVEETKPWSFDAGEFWTVHWPEAQGQPCFKVVNEKESSRLEIRPGGVDRDLPYYSSRVKTKDLFERVRTLRLEIELLEGEARVEPTLRDREGKGRWLVLQARQLEPGRHIYEWNIPEEIAKVNGGPDRREVDGAWQMWDVSVLVPGSVELARMRFLDASAVQENHPLDSVRVGFATGHPFHLVVPGETQAPTLTLENPGASPVAFDLRYTLTEYDQAKQKRALALTIPAAGSQTVAIDDDSNRLGIRVVEWTLLSKGGYRVAGRVSYAVMRPTGPTPVKNDEFLFTMCQHSQRFKEDLMEKEMLAAATIGVKVVRDFCGWGRIQTKGPDSWKWEVPDLMVELAGKYDMELIGGVGLCPRWAAPPEKVALGGYEFQFYAPTNLAFVSEFSRRCAERYKGRIRFWELWNEVDLKHFWRGTDDQYLEMQRLMFKAVKAADPDATVLTSGFAAASGYVPGPRYNDLIHKRTLHEAQDSFDVHSIHQHGTFETFRDRLDSAEFKDIRAGLKSDKPIYFTETAMHSTQLGEFEQARQLYKKLVYSWAYGAIGHTWYELRAAGDSPTNPEHHYGLLREDFQPKSGYVAYNTITAMLLDKKLTARLDLGAGVYAYRFSGKDSHVVTGWIEDPAVVDKVVCLRLPDGAVAEAVDLMGNRTPVPRQGDVAIFTIRHEPSFLLVSSCASEPVSVDAVLQLPHILPARPGRSLDLRCEVRNSSASGLDLTASWGLPPSLCAEGETNFVLRVPAGGSGTILARVMPGVRTGAESYSDPVRSVFRYRLGNAPETHELATPVALQTLVRHAPVSETQPLFELNAPHHVVSIFDHDPSMAHLVWKGPQDLSAKIWCAREGETLNLRTLVEDDRHNQPEQGSAIWKADSIQFGLQVAGQPGWWEFGVAHGVDGKPIVTASSIPEGMPDPTPALIVQTRREGRRTAYDVAIPLEALALSSAKLKSSGMKFNLIVNDRDDGPREGWAQIAPGIGEAKNPGKFLTLLFE